MQIFGARLPAFLISSLKLSISNPANQLLLHVNRHECGVRHLELLSDRRCIVFPSTVFSCVAAGGTQLSSRSINVFLYVDDMQFSLKWTCSLFTGDFYLKIVLFNEILIVCSEVKICTLSWK